MVEVRKGTVSETGYIKVVLLDPSIGTKEARQCHNRNNAGLAQALGCGGPPGTNSAPFDTARLPKQPGRVSKVKRLKNRLLDTEWLW